MLIYFWKHVFSMLLNLLCSIIYSEFYPDFAMEYVTGWHGIAWDNPKWQQLHKIRIVSVLYFQIEHWSRISVILSHRFRMAEAHLFLIVTLEFLSCKGPIWDPRIVIEHDQNIWVKIKLLLLKEVTVIPPCITKNVSPFSTVLCPKLYQITFHQLHKLVSTSEVQ